MSFPIIPKPFEQKFRSLLGADFEPFIECCRTKGPRTVRPNLFKISVPELQTIFEKYKIETEPHPVFRNVLTVKTPNIRLGLLPEHRDGLFVVQDVSSMIPAMVLNPSPTDFVLDLAAAPGMKTCQMAEQMKDQGAIVALDSNRERLKGLRFNLNRLGIINALVVHQDGRGFRSRQLFDRILLDAPCSSEGVIRKRLDALENWSQRLVEKKAVLQKQLIQNAFSLLKENGELVYSTCTLSPEENEEIIQFLLEKNRNAELEKIAIPGFRLRSGLPEYNGKKFDSQLEKAVRVLPQDNDSEAFFVARIRKVKK
jgi:NOL1/NOP2/sun family putative RNA methylase